ncbi:bifunctional DNA-formamidopyrimidine glycosylase/DNA-(apurinic or apyrimidinic site) lyase [Desulfovibrio sp. OttesenSCG-928-I05]|nr:bifunctional DNA-formamidopyrimidine glycosylase/DNA-(apurinic or apyrimidinic site) lyase [Desulfovibrio sp. OttesenSCG-928-I05]
MPELPEVETVARTLAPQVVGRFIDNAEVLLPKTLQTGHAFLPELRGGRIAQVWRRAKLLLVDVAFDDPAKEPLTLAFHLKMTGRLFVYGPEEAPGKHTRLRFGLSEEADGPVAAQLFFDDTRTFGYCRIMREPEFTDWKFWKELGPEPLLITPEEFAERFKSKRGGIKAALLNQGMIAGVGNIYADESLFLAGIRPDAPCCELGEKRLVRLAGALRDVLEESIRQCGSSIRDYRDANGNAGAFQNTFNVYGRHGESCRVCGKTLKKSVAAGRTTVHCPHCQR